MTFVNSKLGEIGEVAAGGGAPQGAESFTVEGTPFIRAGSLNPLVNGASESTLERLSDEVAKKHGLRKFPPDTVVFAKSGMSATKGHIYRLRNEAYVVNHLAAIIPSQRVVPEFLEYSLRVFSPVRLIQDAAYPSVRLSDVATMEIPLPPLPEQRRIAEVLDRAEALRAKRRAALAELDSLTQSIFLDMFGDPMLNQKEWKTCRLDEIASKITDGTHKTPIYKDSGIEFLSAKDLKEGGIAWGTGKFISPEEHHELVKRCNPEVGDILLAKSGSLGNVAIIDRAHQFSLFESLCLIKQDRKLIEGLYLSGLLRVPSMLAHLLGKNKGVAIKHLHLVDVRNLRIPLPPLSLQREFAERVAAVERLKAAQRASLAELDELFASLQHRAFRGEL